MILRFSNFVRNIQNYFFAIIYLLKRSNFLYVFFFISISFDVSIEFISRNKIQFFLFLFLPTIRGKRMQRIKETWIKMFFFSKEVFQCEFAGEKNNPWLHFFFFFFSFVTAILSFFFLDSSYYTRIRIRPTFRKKEKKKERKSEWVDETFVLFTFLLF